MSVRADILKTLANSRNVAAERALEAALREATGAEQAELADVLMERNRRGGWVALIRNFHKLDGAIQEKMLGRPRDLFGPLAETMHDSRGPARENVIAIVRRCADARLVYLLAEALLDARPEVRALAGHSLLDAVRRHWQALHTGDSAPSPMPEESEQLRKAVELGLRQFKTHRQNSALLAALIHERQQESWLWPLFADTYDERTRAATIVLRAPSEPALAAAVLLGLGSCLKPAAMAGLGTAEAPALAGALAAESYRLLDPVLREAAQGVGHLKMLPALRKEPLWDLDNWLGWLRLIESVGLQPLERLTWLTRLVRSAPAGPAACAWKICAARALAETGLPEAAGPLGDLARDADERVARCAGRFLLSRRLAEWRERAAQILPASPHASVRRLPGASRPLRDPEASGAPARPPRGGDRTWNDGPKPPLFEPTALRAGAPDPALADLMHAPIQGTSQDVAQALKLIAAQPNPAPQRNQIIAWCGHADARIAALAVRQAGRLEDPRLRELLEAAAHHADARVRANAVEAMEQLRLADRSPQVRAMLDSRHNRERANAIKALAQSNYATAREHLERMLTDANPLHRMSALWVVAQLRTTEIMRQVRGMAHNDPNLRVRKRAEEMLETVGGMVAAPS